MAVTRGALVGGLALRPGSLRLIALRVVTLIGLGLPSFFAARSGITARLGADPRVDQSTVQSMGMVQDLLSHVPPAALGLAFVALLLFWLFEQVLVAGALGLLDPGRAAGPVRVWATIWDGGWRHFWPFVRVAWVDVGLAIAGLFVVSLMATFLGRHLDAAGAGATTQLLLLPALVIGLAWAWLSLVGTFGLWCRLLIVADGRRRVRRVVPLVLRALWRVPLRGLGLFAALLFGCHLLGGLLVLVQAPGRGGSLGWLGAWLIYLLLQAYLWHALLHAGRRLYAEGRFDPVRAGSDESFGVWGVVRRLLRARPSAPQ